MYKAIHRGYKPIYLHLIGRGPTLYVWAPAGPGTSKSHSDIRKKPSIQLMINQELV